MLQTAAQRQKECEWYISSQRTPGTRAHQSRIWSVLMGGVERDSMTNEEINAATHDALIFKVRSGSRNMCCLGHPASYNVDKKKMCLVFNPEIVRITMVPIGDVKIVDNPFIGIRDPIFGRYIEEVSKSPANIRGFLSVAATTASGDTVATSLAGSGELEDGGGDSGLDRILRVTRACKQSTTEAVSSGKMQAIVPQCKAVNIARCEKCGEYRKRCDLKVCGRCRKIWYCGKGCQTSDWSSHRLKCVEVGKYGC